MRPAFSVILLTTLIGVGQGLFLALYAAELGAMFDLLPVQDGRRFFAAGDALALAFLTAGLLASFFHLGRPERAWRSAAMWRTSWLSREVIVLPAFMAAVFGHGVSHYFGLGGTLMPGALGVLLCLVLFVCTGMIYACLKFLQEWATPLTVVNYILLGCASGFTFATAFAAAAGPGLTETFGRCAVAFTLAALCTRVASLVRNARIKPRSSLQTAIGVKHPRIAQKAEGFMGGSFNTREFFYGKEASPLRAVKWGFLVLTFPVPLALLLAGMVIAAAPLLAAAFAIQYLGLIAERWFFFAQASHPQNLYYQAIS
ncbi:MAG: DMSO reductase [Betaproteobacteria bacterium RIFCSPLOWO2_12_FULL_62_58]|nr:MAG: DMSO reductase [Betaproteobacteria bacterium RIFCSPLOWO2_12_FULL_62_58]OHC29884.1 MAG: DMSO reductase [Pseudomonadales bacterium RIFCSPLOWO2_12_59_9]